MFDYIIAMYRVIQKKRITKTVQKMPQRNDHWY